MSKSAKRTITILCVCFTLFSIVVLTLLHFTHQQYFTRYDYRETTGYRYIDVEDQYPREVVTFASGKNKLTGYVYGHENTKGLVVFSHGLEGGADDYLHVLMFLVDQGWRVFAFDNTGSHRSEGKTVVGHAQSALDLDSALTYIKSNTLSEGMPIMLMGHSWGGYAVAAVLNYGHDVAAVVSASGYDTPLQQMYYQMQVRVGTFGPILFPYLRLYMYARFGKLTRLSAVEGINTSTAPVLVLQGTDDPFYGSVSSIYANRDRIKNPKCVLYLMDEDHNRGHINYFYSIKALAYQDEMMAEPIQVDLLYDVVDRSLWNEVNEELLGYINTFFEQSLEAHRLRYAQR